MKDFNFDKMKNFNVSDEWADRVIDTVLDIKPSSQRYVKIIATCACMIFVCAVSVFFFSFMNKDSVAVPIHSTTESENNQIIELTQPVIDETKTPIDNTQKETKNEAIKETLASNGIIENTEPTKATQVFQDKSTTPPTTIEQTQPSKPDETPTLPQHTEPVEEVTQPPQSSGPEDGSDLQNNGDCIVSIPPSFLVGNGNVYCRIRTNDNQSIGDNIIYSDEHLAKFYSGFGSMRYYLYSPQSVGLVLEPGIYRYHFYNEHGVPICDIKVIVE